MSLDKIQGIVISDINRRRLVAGIPELEVVCRLTGIRRGIRRMLGIQIGNPQIKGGKPLSPGRLKVSTECLHKALLLTFAPRVVGTIGVQNEDRSRLRTGDGRPQPGQQQRSCADQKKTQAKQTHMHIKIANLRKA